MATMQCIKTGCHLYSKEYGMYFSGDLYYKGPAFAASTSITDAPRVYVLGFNAEAWEPLRSRIHCAVSTIDLPLGMYQVGTGGGR